MKKTFRGFLFTLDAIFSLIIASLAVSTLLYVSFVTPVASSSNINKASSIMQSMLGINIGQAIGNGSITQVFSNPFISYNPSSYQPIFYSTSHMGYSQQIPNLQANSISVSVWVYPTGYGSGTYTGSNNNAYNGSGSSIISDQNGYALALYPNGDLYYAFNAIGGGSWDWINTGRQIPLNTWSSIIMSYSKTTGSFYIYDNGSQVYSASYSGSVGIANAACVYQFSIGGNCYQNQNFDGSIFNVQIYNNSLNAAQAQIIYKNGIDNLPINKNNLYGWWPLDGNANDYSTGRHNLKYSNVMFNNLNLFELKGLSMQTSTPLLQAVSEMYMNGYGGYASQILSNVQNSSDYGIFVNGKYLPSDYIAYFNGTSSYINATQGYNLKNFSISAWFSTTTLKNETIETGNPTTLSHSLSIYNGNSICTNKVSRGGYFIVGSYNNVNVCASINPIISTWYNVVTTYNKTSLDIYVNGSLNGNVASTGTPGTSNFETIGNCLTCTKYDFNGNIANVQIYNKTLNATQISNTYGFGIEGAPLYTTRLYGWWPLDGNANDYTNNYNTGIPTNIIYQNVSYIPFGLVNSFLVSRSFVVMGLEKNNSTNIDNVSILVWR